MGCFNVMGFHTHLPIVCYDDVVLFLGVKPRYKNKTVLPDTFKFAPGIVFTPIALPIFGTYNDYGNIENIIRDENVAAIERFFGHDIEKVLRIVDDEMAGRYMKEDDIKTYNDICTKIHDMQSRFTMGSEFEQIYDIVFTMDHRFMYETIKKLMPATFDFNMSIDKTFALIGDKKCWGLGDNEFNVYNAGLDYNDSRRIISVKPGFIYPLSFWGIYDGFDESSALAVYNSDDETKKLCTELKSNYIDFLTFVNVFVHHQWCFGYHVYGTQQTHYKTSLPYYEEMVKFIEKSILCHYSDDNDDDVEDEAF